MDETLIWFALSRIPGMGRKLMESLLQRMGSPQAISVAQEADLISVDRLTPAMARAIRQVDWQGASQDLAELQKEGIEFLHWCHSRYPPNLTLAADRPAVLQVWGRLQAEDAAAVSIVGATRPSASSQRLAHELAGGLARAGLTIVSGLARGIDAAAHRGALEAGGRTIAALGCGLRNIYPPEHRGLAQRIAVCGAVVSELDAQAEVTRPYLMARNRITSGLARATIVVESRRDSGSLQTASFARRQGRLLFAVDQEMEGNQKLLAEGAERIPAEDDWDLDELVRRVRDFRPLPRADGGGQLSIEFP